MALLCPSPSCPEHPMAIAYNFPPPCTGTSASSVLSTETETWHLNSVYETNLLTKDYLLMIN